MRSKRAHTRGQDHVRGGIVYDRRMGFREPFHFSPRDPYAVAGHTTGRKNSHLFGAQHRTFPPAKLRGRFFLTHFREMSMDALAERPGELGRSFQKRIGLSQNRSNSQTKS